MKSRYIKLFLAVMLSVMALAAVLPGTALAEDTPGGEGNSAQPVTAASWSDLQLAINNAAESTVITIEGDLTAQGEDRLLVKGKKLTIDLQGHTLDRQRDSCDENGHVFEVTDGSEITIKSSAGVGVITGGWAVNGGGIYNIGTLNDFRRKGNAMKAWIDSSGVNEAFDLGVLI